MWKNEIRMVIFLKKIEFGFLGKSVLEIFSLELKSDILHYDSWKYTTILITNQANMYASLSQSVHIYLSIN